MTSGRKLTTEQTDSILQLAGKLRENGDFMLSYKAIAARLEINERTVRRCIRVAAVRWGKRTAWKRDETI